MSENKAAARPRQVTMAVSMSVVGSLLLVVSLFDTLGSLRTPEMRESIDETLARPPSNAFDVETAQVIEAMRVLVFISGALAAMLLVFAVFLLQRHKGARIGFTVAAALLLLTIPVAGLMPVLLAVAAGLIWSRPARDWYAGRAPTPAPAAPAASTASTDKGAPAPPAAPILSEQGPPRSPQPFGGGRSSDPAGSGPPAPDQPSAPSAPGPPAYGYPDQPQPPYPPYPSQYESPRDPGKRPVTVTIAAALTWLGAGAVTAAMLLLALLLATQGELFIEELDRAAEGSQVPLNRDDVLAAGWGITLFFGVWSLIAIVLALLAFRRNNAARIALAVSAVMAALLSLLMILSGISVVTLLISGAAAVLLFTGGANEWYSGRNAQPPGGSGYSAYPGYPGYPGYADQPPFQPPPFHPPPDAPPPERPKPW